MYFDEYHDHKWAKNLALALGYWRRGEFERLYRGVELTEGDFFPGLRVMAAYWSSVEHEMPYRLSTLLKGSGHENWLEDSEIKAKCEAYLGRFVDDMAQMVSRPGSESLLPLVNAMRKGSLDMPDDWAETMRAIQTESEAKLAAGDFPRELLDRWLGLCLRSVANYNRFLIRGAVCAASLVKREGRDALVGAIDRTSEDFMWGVSKEFFVKALPKAGFEDIGDLMELGLRGMYADQYFHSEPEVQEGEKTIRYSVLENCELAGVYAAVEAWEGLAPRTLGYGFCRFCEVHGLATMMITMPPMVAPTYVREASLGIDGLTCRFRLTTVPADDMPRILEVQERVFGSVDEGT